MISNFLKHAIYICECVCVGVCAWERERERKERERGREGGVLPKTNWTFVTSDKSLMITFNDISAHHHHHHHVVRLARIFLTLSLHVSLSFIASGRSSGSHPASSHSCCMYVRAGRLAFDWPYAVFHGSTSLTISSLLLQQCPACLVCLACIVFVIVGRWPYKLVPCGVLLPGLVQYCSQHSCIIAI